MLWIISIAAWTEGVWRQNRRLRWELAIVVGVLAILAFAVFVLPIVNLRHC